MKISKFAAVNQTVNSMKHILVTGCRGQLGNELQQAVRQQQEAYRIFFTDKEELDICDPNAVAEYIKSNSIQTVINCAAFTAVDKAESETELCDLLNHKAPGYLAEAIAAVGGEMIQISTDYVFDGSGHTPYSEEAPTNPNSVYGRTKLAGHFPLILTGDFNMDNMDPSIQELNEKMTDARSSAKKTDSFGTFNGWGTRSSIIDYIYYKGFKMCTEYITIREKYAGKSFISDHYPIKGVLKF